MWAGRIIVTAILLCRAGIAVWFLSGYAIHRSSHPKTKRVSRATMTDICAGSTAHKVDHALNSNRLGKSP